jgi:DNA-binding transcriptional LysR family regulator
MDIQHRHIEVFRAVMTAGSVTGAAALLHTSQPTLSRDLARLEQLLGYALFERERGRLKPTARARQPHQHRMNTKATFTITPMWQMWLC